MLDFLGDGDQYKFGRKPPPFFNAKSPSIFKEELTTIYWRADQVKFCLEIPELGEHSFANLESVKF